MGTGHLLESQLAPTSPNVNLKRPPGNLRCRRAPMTALGPSVPSTDMASVDAAYEACQQDRIGYRSIVNHPRRKASAASSRLAVTRQVLSPPAERDGNRPNSAVDGEHAPTVGMRGRLDVGTSQPVCAPATQLSAADWCRTSGVGAASFIPMRLPP